MKMRILSRAVLVGLLVLLVTVTGRSAVVLLLGTIVDPAGIVIPGATVELVSGTRVAARVVTAADGTFRFADVAAGAYEIRVTLAGFRQTRATVTIGAKAPPPLRLKLLIGSASETVNVAETSPVAKPSPAPVAAPGQAKSVPPPAAGIEGGVVGGVPGGVVGGYVGGGRGVGLAGGMYPITVPDAESYAAIDENKFRRTTDQPLSTFSIDVDTASYANVRRLLHQSLLPPGHAGRVEELMHYFHLRHADSVKRWPLCMPTVRSPL